MKNERENVATKVNAEEMEEVMSTIFEDNSADGNIEEISSKVDFKDTFNRNFKRLVIKQNPITTKEEVVNLVRQYYDIQGMRVAMGNRQFQIYKRMKDEGKQVKENISFQYAVNGLKETEAVIKKWLEEYAKNDPIGQWLMSIHGIGPVLAAGFIANLDINKTKTAGGFWAYAGIDCHHAPRQKGVKINYNPGLKVLCFKAGESFIKQQNNPKDIYGKLYAEKYAYYTKKNEEGGFADFAKQILSEKNFSKATEAKKTYESGKLPKGHINAMARRYAVKIFLSHLFEVWYEYENGVKPPKPFVEEHLGHVHIMSAPNKEILGLTD